MALLNEDFLRSQVPFRKSVQESAGELRRGAIKSFDPSDKYDVFLSHSYLDAKVIEGLKNLLERKGLSVYVDWMENPELDRSHVTPETAEVLREAMKRSKSLLYAVSRNSTQSRWTPWELGYSDALHGRVAVLPISKGSGQETGYQGIEYLGLYPYIDSTSEDGILTWWVNGAPGTIKKSVNGYVNFTRWRQGVEV